MGPAGPRARGAARRSTTRCWSPSSRATWTGRTSSAGSTTAWTRRRRADATRRRRHGSGEPAALVSRTGHRLELLEKPGGPDGRAARHRRRQAAPWTWTAGGPDRWCTPTAAVTIDGQGAASPWTRDRDTGAEPARRSTSPRRRASASTSAAATCASASRVKVDASRSRQVADAKDARPRSRAAARCTVRAGHSPDQLREPTACHQRPAVGDPTAPSRRHRPARRADGADRRHAGGGRRHACTPARSRRRAVHPPTADRAARLPDRADRRAAGGPDGRPGRLRRADRQLGAPTVLIGG